MPTHHHHHHNGQHPSPRGSLGLVILFNVMITVVEYIGGFLSGSLALVSDATHNLSDVLALILGFVGERLMRREPDLDFSFGLRRIEVATALINALTLVAIAAFILIEALDRYQNPHPIAIEVMLPVALVGLLGNVFSIVALRGQRDRNLNLRAAFLHLFYDALSSGAVIAVALILLFWPAFWLDPLISLVIVVMIASSAVGIIRESLRIFLQVAPAHLDTAAIQRSLESASGGGVHGLHIWSVNSTEVFLSCHICLGEEAVVNTDQVLRSVNAELERRYGITHTAIQVERSAHCRDGGGPCCSQENPSGRS